MDAINALPPQTRVMVACPLHIKKGRKIADELNLLLSKGFARILVDGSMKFIEELIGADPDAIKSRLVKISDRNEGGKTDEEMETAIKQIISEAITADNVIDIFDAAGLKKPNIEILDERFLQELKDLPQKNLAIKVVSDY